MTSPTYDSPAVDWTSPVAADTLTAGTLTAGVRTAGTLVAGTLGGGALGALALAGGAYVARHGDHLTPLLADGALAGAVSAIVYLLLGPWSGGREPRQGMRRVAAALAGTFVLAASLRMTSGGLTTIERMNASIAWLGASLLLFALMFGAAQEPGRS